MADSDVHPSGLGDRLEQWVQYSTSFSGTVYIFSCVVYSDMHVSFMYPYALMHMDVRMYIINTGSAATIYRFIDNINIIFYIMILI